MDDLLGTGEVSPDLENELQAQYSQLLARIETERQRTEMLETLAQEARSRTAADEKLLGELAEVLGIACQLRIEQLDRRLRGQRLREIAVEILASRVNPGAVVHYRDWLAWVKAEGFTVSGKDPTATFLAQVNRSPLVAPEGRRSGRYRLVARP